MAIKTLPESPPVYADAVDEDRNQANPSNVGTTIPTLPHRAPIIVISGCQLPCAFCDEKPAPGVLLPNNVAICSKHLCEELHTALLEQQEAMARAQHLLTALTLPLPPPQRPEPSTPATN
ncbi:hypothetical protein FRB99_003484, partial [Tulasnella sp. 403]